MHGGDGTVPEMPQAPVIDGRTVSLRPPRDADAEAWVRAGVQPEIALGYGVRVERGPIAPEDAMARVRSLQESPFGWIIETADEVVGHIALHSLDPVRRDAFVALGLLRDDLLDRGYGTAALRAVVGWASGPPLSLRTVHLRVAEYNVRAIASYRKSGFVAVGREERAFELDGRWVADVVMCCEPPATVPDHRHTTAGDDPLRLLRHFHEQREELGDLLRDALREPGDLKRAELLSDQLFLMQETLGALGVSYALGSQADWHRATDERDDT